VADVLNELSHLTPLQKSCFNEGGGFLSIIYLQEGDKKENPPT
jgi:hypothetical protein